MNGDALPMRRQHGYAPRALRPVLFVLAGVLHLLAAAQYTGSIGRGDAMVAFVPPALPSITTGTIAPANYLDGAAVSVPFTITGTFMPGNTFTAQLSDAAGSFASPVNIGTLGSTAAGTIAGTIPAGTPAGTGYRIRVVGDQPAVNGTDNGVNLFVNWPGTIGGTGRGDIMLSFIPAALPSITTGTIAPMNYLDGMAVSVPYTITGTFLPGNTFTAQLSDASGSFASPVNIGTLGSTAAGTIAGTIPAGTPAGTGYRIRVVGDQPPVIGTDNGVNLFVNWPGTIGGPGRGDAMFAILSPLTVLPVELLAFEAEARAAVVDLWWSTATERNNAGFHVERSRDALTFERIGFVPGAGNSTTTRQYTFEDQRPLDGVSYYRLWQQDLDGQGKASPAVAVYRQGTEFTAFPNPTPGELVLGGLPDATCALQVCDARGAPVLVGQVHGPTAQIDLQHLPSGPYFVLVLLGDRAWRATVVRQ
jgi:hypothetical protein